MAEGLDDAGRAFDDLDQAIVGDRDHRVGDPTQPADALLGLAHAPAALEVERLGDDGDRHGAELACHGGDDRRPAGPRTAAFAGGDEHQVGAAQRRLELVARRLHGLATHLGVGAAAEPVGDLLADVDLDVRVADVQLLDIGVDGDELDAFDTGVHHAVDRIGPCAADTDDLDRRDIRSPLDRGLEPRLLAGRQAAVRAPEELAQPIPHARTIDHSAPPARAHGTPRLPFPWGRT